MNIKRLNKKILCFAVDFTLVWGAFKLTQELIDVFNYKEMNEYEDVIDNFVCFMKEQGIDDPVSIFDYYNYALWNGYLSCSHEYQYDGVRDLFLNNPGLACITGEGVCLNKADFLTSIYKEYGYNAYTVICYVDLDKELDIDYIRTNSNIERKKADNTLTKNLNVLLKILKPVAVAFGNHAVTCVEYEGKFYYLDPTNLAYLKKTDFNTMDVMNGNGSMEIKYFSSMYLSNLGMNDIVNASSFDYSSLLYEEAVNIDLEMLETFYDNNNIHYENIDNNIKNQFLLYLLSSFIVNKVVCKMRDSFIEMKPLIKKKVKKRLNNESDNK